MNTINTRVFRCIAIVLLLIIGVASIIATGGGGGGGGAGGSTGPPTGTDPTLAITAANGEDISSAVVIAIGVSFDLGEISGDELIAQAAGDPVYLSGMKGLAPLYSKFSDPRAQAIEGCAMGGNVDVTITVADPNGPTVGDRIVAVFDNCDDNLGYIISGTVDLTIAALQGDPLTDVFLIGFDIILTDIEITEGTEMVTADGGFTLTLDALAFPSITMSLAGEELQFGGNGDTITLTDFDHSLTVDTGVVPDTKLAETFGRLDSQLLGGSVDYDTTTSIEAMGDFDPHTGVILITGASESSVRIVIVDDTSVTLEIDTNGDGVIDEFIDTSWAALNQQTGPDGETSSINTSTAPIVAREVFNAVTGFGSVTVTAGGQFTSNAVFDQVRQQAVSGDFGPLPIDCLASGTAAVSGSIAAAGTFSANDRLNGAFTDCVRGMEELDGGIDVTVSSFDEAPGNTYLVAATATETDLLRFVGGSCYMGNGTFDTSYDLLYSNPGFVYVDSSATTFNVWSGGRSQTLAGAVVNAQIAVGQQPVLITRDSSGTVTSEDLVGSFAYQSVIPDVFQLDEDAATGPHSGELLVTASDGSTMTMVALDVLDLRLDLDFEGDSIIDEQIMTTWATLGYGNAFGLCE
jgi:hypothetical protein